MILEAGGSQFIKNRIDKISIVIKSVLVPNDFVSIILQSGDARLGLVLGELDVGELQGGNDHIVVGAEADVVIFAQNLEDMFRLDDRDTIAGE